MKIDDFVLVAVAAVAGLAGLAYLVALMIGVIATGGMMLPALSVFGVVIGVFVVVVRQRLANSEDDKYEKIER
ncbi:MAG: hypothetical protein AAFV19_01145 [Pseudomonadota bacterium]